MARMIRERELRVVDGTVGIRQAAWATIAAAWLVAASGTAFCDDSDEGRYCSATSRALLEACQHQAADDFLVAKGKCINIPESEEREECFEAARQERVDALQLCRAQRAERLALCRRLGEGRYHPSFDPVDFETDFRHLTNPNPYFPLTIGYRWDYAGGDERNTIVVLDETKLIEGVSCIVLNDKRYRNDQLVEETDDWYGQRRNGTVDFCGEMVRNFETFPGDVPSRPELLSTDGQWKTGRNGDPSGAYFLGSPTVGAIHRQEFSPGNAEDVAEYLSTNYKFGVNPTLDPFVPRPLADLFCGAGDCVVTGETTALEPGGFHRKYYARGVGFFLEVDPRTGDILELVGCNFDSRCGSLPAR